MLDELVIYKSNKWFLKSHVGNYEGNIKTSLILEYELYSLHEKYNGNTVNDREWLFNHLLIRKYIHRINKDKEFFLRSGKDRESL